ncbi:hypothetical protein BH10BAC2_BH10BAC2_19740 [soil metagenome]
MELDELKSLINERMERVHAAKSSADIALLLGKKTQSVVGKIKLSLILEMIVSLAFTIICIAVAIFGVYTSLRIYFAIFAVVCFLFLPLLYLLFKKTKKLSSTALPVKSNLQALTLLIKEYVKRYFQLTMAFIPISLITAFILGYTDENLYNPELNGSIFSTLIDSPLKISLIVGYFFIFSVGMYYFTRWYLKKLYGNYLIQLEILINELEEKQ